MIYTSRTALALALLLAAGNLHGQGTVSTYQGRLNDGATPANGTYDLTFSAWSAVTAGTKIAGPLTNPAVAVSGGLFTVTLDFGAGVFTGPPRWLEIGVRTNGSGAFNLLAPRQPCAATPYAIAAANAAVAATVSGNVSATQITGTLAAANIGAGTVTGADLAPNAATANLNAAGQTGVASSGLVLSATDNNTNLVNAGYVKIYGSFGTPDVWQAFSNAPTAGPPSARNSHTAVWTGAEMILWGGYGSDYLNDGGRYNPAVDNWNALPVTAGGTPGGRLNHSAVWTGGEMIVWGGVNHTNYLNDGGLYDPVLNAWTYLPGTLLNAPAPRLEHTAIWTGNAMIVWGGNGTGGTLNSGASYNPGLNSWTPLPTASAPGARTQHTAVWTGSEMIVWGGATVAGGTLLNEGGRFNPAANTWTSLPNNLANTPGARQYHTAIWAGTNMIIWGGAGNVGDLNDGGRYSPSENTWTALPNSLPNTPVAREQHSVVWTGAEMIVWGGYNDVSGGLVNNGGRYNPIANTWTAIPSALANSPAARFQHTAIWSGTEMIVWGGAGVNGPLNDGGRFNPTTGAWINLPGAVQNTPSARTGHTAVWTGTEMIVWGGGNGAGYFGDGGRFNPALNNWLYVAGTLPNSPSPRNHHTVVWTGTEMIVWGGVNNSGFLNDGGRFNPALGGWTALLGTLPNAPAGRASHTAVWTGTEMIAWGGLGTAGNLNDGGRFNPASGTWTALASSLNNTPAIRANHTAVWSGAEMIVWGGNTPATCYADGGRYNPALNSWTALRNSLANTPGARFGHTVVWTGAAMLVWGGTGCDATGVWNDGGLFNPAANAWTPIANSLPNSPAARQGHTAVWTGNEMIIWGGGNGGAYFADGGRYNPASNSWNPISAALNSPTARTGHTAVWTGGQMLIWGGFDGTYYNDASGYTPGRMLYLYQRP